MFRVSYKSERSADHPLRNAVSNQAPSRERRHGKAQFLMRLPVLTGFEKIARVDFAVLYFDVEIVKRGYYKKRLYGK